MTIEKNVLFVGPIPPPVHGQSVAFYNAFKGLPCQKKYIINQNVSGKSFFMTISCMCRAVFELFFYLLFKRIDIVYITCSRSKRGSLFDVLVFWLSKAFGAKIINHIHGGDFKDFLESLNGAFRRFICWSYGRVDVFIVLLEPMKSEIFCFPKAQVEVVPNFYERSLEEIQTKTKSKSIRLLYLGNIMKTKGILELLDAYRLLTKKHGNLILNIAGEFLGDSIATQKDIRDAFLKRYRILKEGKRGEIHHLGVVLGRDKINLLRDSDIFVLPTFYKSEAFPLSLIEAMRAGNVIVTTKHNYLPAVVSEKNGCLIDTVSPEAVEEAIAYFVDDRNEMTRIQKYNMRSAKKMYPLERYVERLTAIFENV